VFAISLTVGRSGVAFQSLVVGWAGWFLSERPFSAPPHPDETPILSFVTTWVLWLLPLVLLHPHRRELIRLELRPNATLLPLALAAAVPLSIYSVHQETWPSTPTPACSAALCCIEPSSRSLAAKLPARSPTPARHLSQIG
jgi:hypothetical protein